MGKKYKEKNGAFGFQNQNKQGVDYNPTK